MEEDVRVAAELQRTFFPRLYPTYPRGASPSESCVEFIHHYHASGMVSGDFCTIIPVSPTESGLFLCDVMGHGVRAALVTALICALVEETSSVENDPGRFLARMNKQLLPVLRQEDMFLYATACYMVYNAETGQLRYANAGHPVPILIHSGGRAAEWLMADPSLRGPALAIAEEMDYTTFEHKIAPGDSVLTYTDGLYEVLDGDGREFGEQRLLQAASRLSDRDLKDLVPGLVSDAAAYAVDGEFDDDICVTGFRCHALMDREEYDGT
jgi:sigma-B regulation protein RsbU (phosphoserine phosphatase)